MTPSPLCASSEEPSGRRTVTRTDPDLRVGPTSALRRGPITSRRPSVNVTRVSSAARRSFSFAGSVGTTSTTASAAAAASTLMSPSSMSMRARTGSGVGKLVMTGPLGEAGLSGVSGPSR